MAVGKRQLVLATLVVALGAAVYLNWAFSGNGGNAKLPATQAVASGADRQYGQTLLVNGSAVSGRNSSAAASGKKLSSVPALSQKTAASADEYFSTARLTRQKAHDEAKEEISKVLKDTSSNTTLKKEAVAKAAVITQDILKEADIETLIKAKGYPDCVVTLNNNQCSAIIKTKKLSQKDAAVVQDVVSSQTGLSYDKIRVIERT